MGNLSSVHNRFKRIGADSLLSSKIGDIDLADKLALPGADLFKNGMQLLEAWA